MSIKVQPGEKHNRLTAVRRIDKDVWLWECDCGNVVECSSYSVRANNRKSCGCLKVEKVSKILSERSRKRVNESCKNTLYLTLRASAKKRALLFELDKGHVDTITQQNCYYCGGDPSNKMTVRYNDDVLLYNGLDRVDSSIGYTKKNVVPCCKLCNQAKNNLTKQEFFDWVKRVHNHITKEKL